MKPYTSEITDFLRALKALSPKLEAQQQAGRTLLWDRPPIDLEQTRRWRESRVPQKPYPYQTES